MCLVLGVAALAGVGSLASAINAGLAERGQFLMGGGRGIDERPLRMLAERTGGMFRLATNAKSLEQIYEEIDRLEKTEVETHQNVLYAEWMMWCVAPGAALLLLELIVGNTVWRRLP